MQLWHIIYLYQILIYEDLCKKDAPNIVIAVSILGNSITHAHTCVIMVLCFPLQRTGIYLVNQKIGDQLFLAHY
jgi:hypothetical protein